MVPEAPLEREEGGLVPKGAGWFTLNVADAKWMTDAFGSYTRFEGDGSAKFEKVGFNIGVFGPGQPSCMYHGEADQELFLILSGECLLVIEGEERHLKQWDFLFCPAWTEHVFVGAGDGPCTLLAMGPRTEKGVIYPASELAQSHNAGVRETTPEAKVAYEGTAASVPTEFEPAWLPRS